MKLFKTAIGLLVTFLFASGLHAATKTVVAPSKVFDIAVLDGNQFNMYISNYGKFGQSPEGNSGAWWPANRRLETYIFGAGPWVGAVTKDGDTVVTFFYNPNSGQSEGCPALVPVMYGDSMVGDPTDYETALNDPYARVHVYGKTTGEYEWPVKTYDPTTGEWVDSVVSSLDSYTWFTDLDPDYQESGSKPLGLVIEQTTYQFGVPGVDNIVFLIWKFKNVSGDTLYDVYIGACYDDDVGNEAGQNANDLVGFNRTYDFPDDTLGPVLLNLAYQYQTEPEPGWIGVDGNGLPGVVGSVFLESPIATDTVVVIDTVGQPVGPDTVYPGEQLGMTAFKIFTIQIDPRNDAERYTIMSGWDPPEAGGRYNPFQEDVYGPGDKRFIQCSGPFTMPPGAEARLVVAAVIAPDSEAIRYVAKKAIDIYKNNFIAPRPPAKPNLYAWARDREVYLFWDNTSEITRDKFYDIANNPYYREYDFEGYILRRSLDGEHWDTLGVWDVKDGYTVLYTDSLFDATGAVVYTDSLVVGNDVGLVHSYIDRDTCLKNGVTYTYELIPYDLNFDDFGAPFSLCGPAAKVQVVPHTNPVNVIPPEVEYTLEGATDAFKYDGVVVLSKEEGKIIPGTYRLHFANNGTVNYNETVDNPGYPDITVYVTDEATGDTVVEPMKFEFVQESESWTTKWIGTLPENDIVFAGIGIINPRLEIYVDRDSTFYVIDKELYSTTTSDSSEWRIMSQFTYTWEPNEDTTYFYQTIKHRGLFYPGVYRLTWRYVYEVDTLTGDTTDTLVTLEVVDTLTGRTIPFDSLAEKDVPINGWAFIGGLGAGSYAFKAFDKFPVGSSAGVSGYVFGIRLPGSDLIVLTDFGGTATHPQDGETWIISTQSAINYTRIPQNGESYVIEVTAPQKTDEYSLEDVKVVPNPYLVLTPLDLSKEFRIGGVRFINLPTECEIRIYTLAGDLIKIINVTPEDDGEVTWDLLTEYGTRPASGVYLYHVRTPDGKEKIGKFAVIF